MYFRILYLFIGFLTGILLSAVIAPPTRKVPKAPVPNDTTTYQMGTGCVRIHSKEVPCTAETDSLNLLGTQNK